MNITVYTDGGARGNPGPAAIGVVIKKKDEKGKEKVIEVSKRIGETTNNVAEYTAVVEALRVLKSSYGTIDFFLDSTLVVNQLNGNFKVKDPALRELLMKVRLLEQEVGGIVSYHYIPREQNGRADFLVNRALDLMYD